MKTIKLIQVFFRDPTDGAGVPGCAGDLAATVEQLHPGRKGGRQAPEDGLLAGTSLRTGWFRYGLVFVVAASYTPQRRLGLQAAERGGPVFIGGAFRGGRRCALNGHGERCDVSRGGRWIIDCGMHGCKPGANMKGQKVEIGGSKAGIVECFVSVIGLEGSLGEKTPFSRSRLDRVSWDRGYMTRVILKEL